MDNSLRSRKSWIGLVAVLLLVPMLVFAQEQKERKKGRAFRGRIPQGWSKLDLNDQQKKQLREISLKHAPKMRELQEQLNALRTQMRDEQLTVLTDDQRQQVEKLESQARTKKSDDDDDDDDDDDKDDKDS